MPWTSRLEKSTCFLWVNIMAFLIGFKVYNNSEFHSATWNGVIWSNFCVVVQVHLDITFNDMILEYVWIFLITSDFVYVFRNIQLSTWNLDLDESSCRGAVGCQRAPRHGGSQLDVLQGPVVGNFHGTHLWSRHDVFSIRYSLNSCGKHSIF